MFSKSYKEKKDKKDKKEDEKRSASPRSSIRKLSASKRDEEKLKMMKLGDDSESASIIGLPVMEESGAFEQAVSVDEPDDHIGLTTSSSSDPDTGSSTRSPPSSGHGGFFASVRSSTPSVPPPSKTLIPSLSASLGAGVPRDFDDYSASDSDPTSQDTKMPLSASTSSDEPRKEKKKSGSIKLSPKDKDKGKEDSKKTSSKSVSPASPKKSNVKAESSSGSFSKIKEPMEDNDNEEELMLTPKSKKKGLSGFFTATSTTKTRTGSGASLASSGGHSSPAEVRKEEKKVIRVEPKDYEDSDSEPISPKLAKAFKSEEKKRDKKKEKKESEKARSASSKKLATKPNDSSSNEELPSLGSWQTETGITQLMFQTITRYFSDGNNRVDNVNRAAILGLPEGVRIAPGVNLRIHDPNTLGHDVHIGQFSYINGHVQIDDEVTIGPQCSMTSNTHLFNPDSQSFKGRNESKPIWVKRGCWIAAGVTITAGVTIGECSLVCAGAVVTHDVPDYSIVAGIPARIVGSIDPSTGEKAWFSRHES